MTYMRPVAVPASQATIGLPRLATRFAPSAGIGHLEDDETSWPTLWKIERAVAEAYGISPQDFAHILETFPVWRRRRPGLAAFYDQCLAKWLAE